MAAEGSDGNRGGGGARRSEEERNGIHKGGRSLQAGSSKLEPAMDLQVPGAGATCMSQAEPAMWVRSRGGRAMLAPPSVKSDFRTGLGNPSPGTAEENTRFSFSTHY